MGFLREGFATSSSSVRHLLPREEVPFPSGRGVSGLFFLREESFVAACGFLGLFLPFLTFFSFVTACCDAGGLLEVENVGCSISIWVSQLVSPFFGDQFDPARLVGPSPGRYIRAAAAESPAATTSATLARFRSLRPLLRCCRAASSVK